MKQLAKMPVVVLIMTLFMIEQGFALWKGRMPPISDDIWVYADDSGERELSFIEFENLSEEENYEAFDSFRFSMPRTIGEQIQNYETITVPADDYKPVFTNLDSYQIYEYSFEEIEEERRQAALQAEEDALIGGAKLDEIDDEAPPEEAKVEEAEAAAGDETPPEEEKVQEADAAAAGGESSSSEELSDEAETETNEAKSEKPLYFEIIEDKDFAYILENAAEEKRSVFLFKGEKNFIDANLVDDEIGKSLSVPIKKREDGLRYFALDTKERKKLTINQNIQVLNNLSLIESIEELKGDYFVYGTYKVERVTVTLDVYLVNKNKKSILHVASEDFSSIDVSESLEKMAIDVLAAISQKPIVKNIRFEGNKEAFLMLNNKIVGRLPLTIKQLVADEYSYSVWDRNKELLSIESQLPIDKDTIDITKSDSLFKFRLDETKKGRLKVNVRNDVASYFYLNHLLLAAGQSSFERSLHAGDYFLRVESESYKDFKFLINILPGKETFLNVRLDPISKSVKDSWYVGHASTKKIFAALGFTLGAVALMQHFETLDIEDRRDYLRRKISDGQDAAATIDYERKLSKDYNEAVTKSAALISSSVLSFILTMVFHSLDIFEDRASIATEYQRSRKFKYEYIEPSSSPANEDTESEEKTGSDP